MPFPDPRFFRCSGPWTAGRAAAVGGATLVRGDAALIATVAASGEGGAGALIFVESFRETAAEAEAVIVPEGQADSAPASARAVLEARSPKLAFSRIAAGLFASRSEEPDPDDTDDVVVHASARVHPTAVIGPGAEIGEDAIIGPFAHIGHGVVIGDGCRIGAHASITHAIIGSRCRILSGARIGEAGFGYTPGEHGPHPVPQLGRVILGDDVDIGALTTVDRGTLSDTIIGAHSKIDNLCQVAHNCRLGRGVLVASQTGISGSCVVGDFVMMGGQVGMADHLTIGDGAVLAAKAGLMKDVEAGGRVGGIPAKPLRQWMKETAALGRLASGKK